MASESRRSASSGDAHRMVREYQVFWNNPQGKRLLLLQFPGRNRYKPYNLARNCKPSEVRMKSRTGLIEVDIPIQLTSHHDRDKGRKFAQALRQSKTLQTGGEYGLAGGFGVNVQARHARPANQVPADQGEGWLEDDGGSIASLTLGGRLRVSKSNDPIYAIGVFKEDELYLSKVDGICTLQPQFQHLDALAESDRASSRIAAGEPPAVESEARAVNMSVKSTDTDDLLDVSEVDRTLRTIQEERWQRLEWIDEADSRSFTTYNDKLVLTDPGDSGTLISTMTELQYLDAISAPRVDPTRQGKRVMITRPWEADDEVDVLEEVENLPTEKKGATEGAKAGSSKIKVEVD